MRNIETFAVIGGDLRSAYLAGLLAADGYKVITSGFDSTDLPPCVTGCTNPAQATTLADCVILPLPVTTDGSNINAPFSRMREELAIANSVPAAEGAIQLAMEELPITISGARCLITGYGRVGQALARLLVALGANVTVAARKFSDLARAQTLGCETLEIQHLENAGDFDVIFNTVPVLLFSRDILQRMDRSTLLIDLASKPGGVDFTAAAELQLKTIWALSLPGRVAPKSAGFIIKNAILNMLKEGI